MTVGRSRGCNYFDCLVGAVVCFYYQHHGQCEHTILILDYTGIVVLPGERRMMVVMVSTAFVCFLAHLTSP